MRKQRGRRVSQEFVNLYKTFEKLEEGGQVGPDVWRWVFRSKIYFLAWMALHSDQTTGRGIEEKFKEAIIYILNLWLGGHCHWLVQQLIGREYALRTEWGRTARRKWKFDMTWFIFLFITIQCQLYELGLLRLSLSRNISTEVFHSCKNILWLMGNFSLKCSESQNWLDIGINTTDTIRAGWHGPQ